MMKQVLEQAYESGKAMSKEPQSIDNIVVADVSTRQGRLWLAQSDALHADMTTAMALGIRTEAASSEPEPVLKVVIANGWAESAA